jgi:hypothetical protein
VCVISILSAILPGLIYVLLEQSFFRLCLITVISVLSVCGLTYLIGLSKVEREKINILISGKLRQQLIRMHR